MQAKGGGNKGKETHARTLLTVIFHTASQLGVSVGSTA